MNKLELNSFKRQLEKMRSDLDDLESTYTSSAATVILDQTSVGRLSRMDAMQGQQMALASERRRKAKILQIKAALHRIETDTFGLCLECENEISIGRLSFNPAVTHCVDCAE